MAVSPRSRAVVVLAFVGALCAATFIHAHPAAPKPQKPAERVNPLDRGLPEGALKPVGASPDRFNAPAVLRFSLKGAQFDRTIADVTLTVNGSRIAARRLTISAHLLATSVRLAEGANPISLKAYDTVGRPLYYNQTIWCGTGTLRVDLVGADGSPVHSVATIVAALSGNELVREQQITNRGTAFFKNVPAHKVLISVHTANGETSTAEAFPATGVVRILVQTSSTPPGARVP